ncbi:MAG: hypothetical protein H7318_09885 [Oligoflexus sp.]|nr:hypothetical protein [Oligoflexus sp.]
MNQRSKNILYWIVPTALSIAIFSCSVKPDTKEATSGKSLATTADANSTSGTGVAVAPVAVATVSANPDATPSIPDSSIPVTEGEIAPVENKMTWDYVNKTVFIPNCISCHSLAGGNKGRVNLETYANVKARIDDIEFEVISQQSMPPDAPVDSEAANALKAWIAAGIPETAGMTPTPVDPTPTPVPVPVPVPFDPTPVPVPIDPVPAPIAIDYAYVNKTVIAPFCLSCHSVAGGNKGRINLETFANVTKYLKKIKNEAITSKSMPPTEPLTSNASDILSKWITAGAPLTVSTP